MTRRERARKDASDGFAVEGQLDGIADAHHGRRTDDDAVARREQMRGNVSVAVPSRVGATGRRETRERSIAPQVGSRGIAIGRSGDPIDTRGTDGGDDDVCETTRECGD